MQDAGGDFEVYKYNPSENAFDGSSMGAVGLPSQSSVSRPVGEPRCHQ